MGNSPPPGPRDAPYLCGKLGVDCEYPSCDQAIEPFPQRDCKYRDNTLPEIPPGE